MNGFILILLFVLGATIGSFLNVLVLRMRSGKSIGGRSMCMVCSKELVWYELIPIVSFLVQYGRCRECHSRISWQYVLVEIATALLFTLAGFLLWDGTFNSASLVSLILALLTLSTLVSIFVYDYLHKIIPDPFVLTLIIIGFAQVALKVYVYGASTQLFLNTFLGGCILFIPFYLLWAISKGRWIGLGDGKLAFAIGTLLPFSSAVSAIVLAFWIGALVGVFYLYLQKIKGHSNIQKAIPFGPFMVLGTLIVMFYPMDLFNLIIITEYVQEIL